uniref:Uncharacterized protein n=1 Tax=Arundo donax TaxID=35708 RepID=A0A0A9EA19_ARUDO
MEEGVKENYRLALQLKYNLSHSCLFSAH